MAKPVLMPKQGITVESCILTKWHKKVGEKIAVGEVLFSYETDKSAFDQESEVEGTVLAQFFGEGDEVPVLVNICVVGNEGEDFKQFAPQGKAEEATASEAKAAPAEEVKVAQNAPESPKTAENASAPVAENGVIFASPRAKNLAQKLGVELSACAPTGPKGRIVESDVRTASVNRVAGEQPAVAAAPAEKKVTDTSAHTDEKMSNIRKVIAKSMVTSLSTMAQLTNNISYDCTNIIAFRAFVKANAEKLGLPNITVNDIVMYAVSRVLKGHKALNANLINGDTMRYFTSVNLGMAVDTPRGLMVPTIFGADELSLVDLAVEAKKLAKEAQGGAIDPSKLQGGTFTVSNIGSFGITSFTPVINPPQTGILGVNTFETKIKVGEHGEIIPYQAMNLSLTYDHRAVDGAPASKFLKELKEFLENFSYNMIFCK